MPITNPDAFDRPIVSTTGTLTAASQILTTNNSRESDANTDISTLQDQVRALQQGGTTPANLGPNLQDFEQHLTVAHVAGTVWNAVPNPTQHRGTLTRLFAAYWDENRTGATPFTGNYFDDLADPTITLNGTNYYFTDANKDDASINRLFPGKQSYFTGKLDVSGLPLTNNFQVILGFSHHIAHTLPSGDTPLLRYGSRELIGVDANGLYYLAGNSDGTLANASFRQRLRVTGTGPAGGGPGGQTLARFSGTGTNSVNFDVPLNNDLVENGGPLTFPLALTLRIKRIVNGEASTLVTDTYTITDRDVSQVLTNQIVNVPLLPSGAADETFGFEYDGTNHQLQITMSQISTNTSSDASQIDFEVTYDDSQDINTSTTSTKQRFATQHDTVGNTVDMVVMVQATFPGETSADKFMDIKVVLDGVQENTDSLNFRASAFDFSNLIMGPDSGENVALSNLQLYAWSNGGDNFNTPTHSNLYQFYLQRNSWFGLFRSAARDYRNYTIDGGMILTKQDDTTVDIISAFDNIQAKVVYEAVNTGTGAGGLLNSIQLPTDYADFDFLYIAERDSAGVTWDHSIIFVRLLSQTLLSAFDNVRVNTKSDMTWTVGTRTMTTDTQEMAYIVLVKL